MTQPRSYWKLTACNVDAKSKRADFTLQGYRDPEPPMQHIEMHRFVVQGAEFEAVFGAVEDIPTACFRYAKPYLAQDSEAVFDGSL